MIKLSLLLPALAFALGLTASVYLFVEWLRHGRRSRFPLFWALALFLIYWFQVPAILAKLGKSVTMTDFNLFFALTFPITFLALVLIFWGIIEVLEIRLNPKIKFLFFGWFLLAVVFFAYQFIINEGVIRTHTLPLVGNILFYLPLRTLIILVLVRWLFQPFPKNIYGWLGALSIMGESVLGLIRNFFIVKNVLAYPPEFWYIVLTSLKIFFVLQTASVFLLVLGFFFFHRAYYRTAR